MGERAQTGRHPEGGPRRAADSRSRPRRRAVPAVMFQGTASNVGKSVLAAAFCRIVLQDGYRVGPFKAQNMSLNSYVTAGGGEMGRAQVVQAQACRLDPDVRMNPVLLKPSTERGAQVIVCGKPVGTMNVSDYHAYLDEARRQVRRAYDSLAAECEVVVLEGAGSPAEVNLRDSDIVNMDMAAYARSPVVLVGDIDRGGVFAALVGTMALLTQRDRRLVAGYVLNKFRGEPSLLGEALERTTMLTGIPCWGVVPFIPQLGLPDEDSVAFKGERAPQWTGRDERVRIALVDLPHISNVSDFDPFKAEPDVEMRVVRSLEDFDAGPDGQGEPDVVMLPGSKNTLADLSYLRGTGLAERIAALARSGKVEVVGVCGGFQMLGGTIADPLAVEYTGPAAAGLGLLPFDTVMAQEKTLRLVRGRHLASAMEIHGYEIHHGRSELRGAQGVPVVAGPDGEGLGLAGSGGLVWGTYLHGLFDADGFRRWFIDNVRLRKGMEPLGRVMAAYDLEPALENLARVVRESIDVGAIYRRIGLR